MFAVIDFKERFSQLDTVAGKTPAQVEMKDDIIKSSREKQETNTQSNYENKNLFNEKIKQQQNNNLPQNKQPHPLDIKN